MVGFARSAWRLPLAGCSVEITFNVLAVAVFLVLKVRLLPGQHFHILPDGLWNLSGPFTSLYADSRGIWGSATGYRIASLLVFILGAGGFDSDEISPASVAEGRAAITG